MRLYTFTVLVALQVALGLPTGTQEYELIERRSEAQASVPQGHAVEKRDSSLLHLFPEFVKRDPDDCAAAPMANKNVGKGHPSKGNSTTEGTTGNKANKQNKKQGNSTIAENSGAGKANKDNSTVINQSAGTKANSKDDKPKANSTTLPDMNDKGSKNNDTVKGNVNSTMTGGTMDKKEGDKKKGNNTVVDNCVGKEKKGKTDIKDAKIDEEVIVRLIQL